MTNDTGTDPALAPRPHRLRRIGLAGAAAAAVALGCGAIAATASADSSPAGASTAYGGYGTPPSGAPTGAPKARTPHLDGKVKSVSGSKILITDFDGFTRTINTSTKTVYKDGLTASPKVGTQLHAEGTVDADGTSLDATLISAQRQQGQGGRPGDGHGGGPGGPGNGSRPSGAPSGAPTGAKPSAAPSSS